MNITTPITMVIKIVKMTHETVLYYCQKMPAFCLQSDYALGASIIFRFYMIYLLIQQKYHNKLAIKLEHKYQIGQEIKLIRLQNIFKMTMKQIDGFMIEMDKKLGQGSFGSVYRGFNKITKEKVAVKMLTKQSIDNDNYLKAALNLEIKLLKSLHSQNIVILLDVMESSRYYYLVQQLCDGDLSKIMKPGKKLSQNESIKLLIQISNGFRQLVREGIVHRDMKPANVMTKNGVLKIGDFGFAKKIVSHKMKNKTFVGTPLYMSLQILKSQPYSSKADIWAIGTIFYEMLHGDTPWIAATEYQLIKNIEQKGIKLRTDISDNAKDFITKCLQKEQKDRIDWDGYFTHPIFAGYFNSYADKNKEFENKLKTIMSQLRFSINSQNLDLSKLLAKLGYNSKKSLDSTQFYRFLKAIHSDISKQQAFYIFGKTDINNDGTISIKEIQNQMAAYDISFVSKFDVIPGFNKNISYNNQPEVRIDEGKIRCCFKTMEKIINKNKISLFQIFNKYDTNHSGKLNFPQFKAMIKSISDEFKQQQLQAIFNLIDADNSNSIQFKELNKYYSKVNGICCKQLESLQRKPSSDKYQIVNQQKNVYFPSNNCNTGEYHNSKPHPEKQLFDPFGVYQGNQGMHMQQPPTGPFSNNVFNNLMSNPFQQHPPPHMNNQFPQYPPNNNPYNRF